MDQRGGVRVYTAEQWGTLLPGVTLVTPGSGIDQHQYSPNCHTFTPITNPQGYNKLVKCPGQPSRKQITEYQVQMCRENEKKKF